METRTDTSEQDVRQKAEDTASRIAGRAEQAATSQLSTQKDRAASSLHTLAESLRESGREVRDEQPQIASLTDEAARRIDDASSYLQQHDVRDLLGEVENFARREPLIFMAGAFALGFGLARFVKASSPSAQPQGRSLGAGTGARYAAQRYESYGAQRYDYGRETRGAAAMTPTTGTRQTAGTAGSAGTTAGTAGTTTGAAGTTTGATRAGGATQSGGTSAYGEGTERSAGSPLASERERDENV